MEITYTDKLIAYMERKGRRLIVIELVDSATSTSGFTDICAKFASEGLVARLEREHAVVRRYDAPVGELLITARALEYDEHVELDLRSFLGIKDIKITGIRAF